MPSSTKFSTAMRERRLGFSGVLCVKLVKNVCFVGGVCSVVEVLCHLNPFLSFSRESTAFKWQRCLCGDQCRPEDYCLNHWGQYNL